VTRIESPPAAGRPWASATKQLVDHRVALGRRRGALSHGALVPEIDAADLAVREVERAVPGWSVSSPALFHGSRVRGVPSGLGSDSNKTGTSIAVDVFR